MHLVWSNSLKCMILQDHYPGELADMFSMQGNCKFFGVSKGTIEVWRPMSMDTPDHTPHPHHNQLVTACNRSGDCWWTHFVWGNWRFSVFRRGTIEVTFHNKVANLNGCARSHTSPTQQCTSDCVGACWIDQGIAGGHIFYGEISVFWCFEGGR